MTVEGWHERPWGRWRRLYVDWLVELRVLEIDAGGHSSIHRHNTKFNTFEVVRGWVELRLFQTGELDRPMQVADLRPTSRADWVPAGLVHQFHAKTDSLVYEMSRVVPGRVMDADEIERFTEAGKCVS